MTFLKLKVYKKWHSLTLDSMRNDILKTEILWEVTLFNMSLYEKWHFLT